MHNTIKNFYYLTIICLFFSFILSGCGTIHNEQSNAETNNFVEPGYNYADNNLADSVQEDNNEENELFSRYSIAYQKHDPNEIVLWVNGDAIIWSEYFSWLFNIASQLELNYNVLDWDVDIPELKGYFDVPSYNTYVLSYAETNSVQTLLIEQQARELEVKLTDEQTQMLQDNIDSYIEDMGSEAFEDYLDSAYITRQYFDRQSAVSILYGNIHDKLFGANGENLSNEDAVNIINDQGFIHAKHILFMTVDDNGNPIDSESIKMKKELSQEVLNKMRMVSSENLDEAFDKLMIQYSEDPGCISFPNGYYFQEGEMVPSFESSAKSLGINEISDLVESEYGIHIIYRPIINADDIMGFDSNYQPYTVRQYASDAVFNNMLYDWYDNAKIEYSSEFEEISLQKLFVQN